MVHHDVIFFALSTTHLHRQKHCVPKPLSSAHPHSLTHSRAPHGGHTSSAPQDTHPRVHTHTQQNILSHSAIQISTQQCHSKLAQRREPLGGGLTELMDSPLLHDSGEANPAAVNVRAVPPVVGVMAAVGVGRPPLGAHHLGRVVVVNIERLGGGHLAPESVELLPTALALIGGHGVEIPSLQGGILIGARPLELGMAGGEGVAEATQADGGRHRLWAADGREFLLG